MQPKTINFGCLCARAREFSSDFFTVCTSVCLDKSDDNEMYSSYRNEGSYHNSLHQRFDEAKFIQNVLTNSRTFFENSYHISIQLNFFSVLYILIVFIHNERNAFFVFQFHCMVFRKVCKKNGLKVNFASMPRLYIGSDERNASMNLWTTIEMTDVDMIQAFGCLIANIILYQII